MSWELQLTYPGLSGIMGLVVAMRSCELDMLVPVLDDTIDML